MNIASKTDTLDWRFVDELSYFTAGGEWTLEAYRPLMSSDGDNFNLKIGGSIKVAGKLETVKNSTKNIFTTLEPKPW
jgi:hypothetical protein